jgi:hypothetical protein
VRIFIGCDLYGTTACISMLLSETTISAFEAHTREDIDIGAAISKVPSASRGVYTYTFFSDNETDKAKGCSRPSLFSIDKDL